MFNSFTAKVQCCKMFDNGRKYTETIPEDLITVNKINISDHTFIQN